MGEQTNHDLLRPSVPATLLPSTRRTRHEERIRTLVSADISGFIALPERLAFGGKAIDPDPGERATVPVRVTPACRHCDSRRCR
jgi:hypothetical protein